MLDKIRIVMVEPSHSGNIGATARAMKNMGLTQLALVSPGNFPDQVALTRASGADDILQNAAVVDTLKDALVGVEVVYGASARSRTLSLQCFTAREACETIVSEGRQAAIVFGRENSGLTNEELALCHYHLTIPTVEDFSSLNLSQAIQVVAYELRVAVLGVPSVDDDKTEHDVATHEIVEGFISHLETTLTNIEFLNPQQPKMLMKRLRRLFSRAHMDTTEVNILRGILAAVERVASHSSILSKEQ